MAAWVAELAASVLRPNDVASIADRIDSEIAVELPVFGNDLDLRRDLGASTIGQLRSFAASLLVGELPTRPAPEAVELARTIARRGMDLSVILGIYRHGEQAALRFVKDVIEAQTVSEQARIDGLILVWSRASAWFNFCIEHLVTAYSDEREQWLRSAITRRAQVVDTVLGGGPFDVSAAEAVLGQSLRRCQTALVVCGEDDSAGAARLEAAAVRIAAALGAPRPLMVADGSRTVWAWISSGDVPDTRALHATVPVSDSVRVGIGIPAFGIDGFRSSHREAMSALTVSTDRVALYSDVEVISLLAADRIGMSTFVARELGALADQANSAIRETALAYLARGVGGAADDLDVHRNTVRYRVRRAEELVGRSLDERRLELHLALLCSATAEVRR